MLSLCKRTKLPNFGFHTLYGVEFLRLFQHPPKYFWHNKKASLRRQINKKYLAKEVRILHLTETVLEPSIFFFKNSCSSNGKTFKILETGFAPILYLNCEHVLFVSILKQRRKKRIKIFFTKLKTLWSSDVPKNLGPIGSAVLTFIGYKQTNRQTNTQTDRQAKFIYRFTK